MNNNKFKNLIQRLISLLPTRLSVIILNMARQLNDYKSRMITMIPRIFSGYLKEYRNAATQSSERLQRIELLSKAHQLIRTTYPGKISLPNRKVAVIHVPKTGGTSFRHELITNFPHASFLDAGSGPLERADAGELDGFDIIFGHMYLENLAKHRADRYIVVFFRDPVTQAASIYGFLRSFADDPVLSKRADIVAALNYDFDTWVMTSDPNAYNTKRNRYGRTILGEQFKDYDLDKELILMIKQKLAEIDYIGLFEHYNEDSQALLKLLGALSRTEEVWLNRTPERPQKEMISEKIHQLILEKSSLDAEIYRLALLRRQMRLEN